jgi:hypothetical protein
MSNSTRQGGYDERLVVPLEASRRGAHRARVNPLVGALPMIAVVVVVVAVIGVVYTLFFKGSNSTDDASSTTPAASAPANTNQAPSSTAAGGGTSSTKPTTSASASGSAATVDKKVAFTVYNGSAGQVPGLAKKANTALKGEGFTKGQVSTAGLPVSLSQTTRIYYASAAGKATAEAIKSALGVGTVKLNPTVAAQGLVVVIGDDYAG